MRKLVEIVFDPNKNKYRATPVGETGWVRFPNKLRVPGAVYEVENLKQGKSGSWIATGEITLTNGRASGHAQLMGVPKRKKRTAKSNDTAKEFLKNLKNIA